MKRFPLRTLLLMILALVVFVRLWCATHVEQPPPPPAPTGGIDVEVAP